MSESNKNPTHGEPISEEQLDAVSGGGWGTWYDPHQSLCCFFKSAGWTRKDGRKRCAREECIGRCIGPNNPPADQLVGGEEMYRCACWGTENCIDKIHTTHV